MKAHFYSLFALRLVCLPRPPRLRVYLGPRFIAFPLLALATLNCTLACDFSRDHARDRVATLHHSASDTSRISSPDAKRATADQAISTRPDLSGHVSEVSGRERRFSATAGMTDAREDGKHTLIILWATWCAPCVAELPDLNDLQQKSSDDLIVVGLLDELLTRSSKAELARHLTPHSALRFNYYVRDPSLRRALFGSIAGDKTALPAFVLLAPDGRRLVDGRGALTGPANATALGKIRSILREAARDDELTTDRGKPRSPRPSSSDTQGRSERTLSEGRRYIASCAGDAGWLNDLTSAASAFYKKEGMTESDLEGSLGSLVRLLRDSSRWQTKKRDFASRQRIVLWVDVTCETCARALVTAKRAAADLDDRVTYEVVGFDPSSERAAAVLELVRERDPEGFSNAVEEFLSVLPHRTDALALLAEQYLKTPDVEGLPSWASAQAKVRERRKELASADVSTPFAEVDGFRLSRDDRPPYGQVGFDPFADKSLFTLAVRVVRACGDLHGSQ